MIRNIELRDVPTIIGASKNPSPWELWNILAGEIPENNTPPASAFWHRELRNSIISGLQARYNTTLVPLPAMKAPESLVDLSGALDIKSAGSLPLDPENPSTLLLIRQIGHDALGFKWTQNGQTVAPLEEVARAHVFMIAYQRPRCAIYIFANGGSDERIVEIDYDRTFAQGIIDQISEFRQSVETGAEPAPDFAVDLKALESRWKPTDPETIDLSDHPGVANVVSQYQDLTKQKSDVDAKSRDLEKQTKELKAKIKALLGSHQTAVVAPGIMLVCKEICVSAQQKAAFSWQKITVNHTAAAAETAAQAESKAA